MKKREDDMNRQTNVMSSIGLFYLMIIALFAIPLLGAFVALFIKGVVDFKYAIIVTGVALLCFAVYYLAKLSIHLYRRIRHNSMSVRQDFQQMSRTGEPVEVSLLNGMMRLSYQGGMPRANPQQPLQLPGVFDTKSKTSHIITSLKELSELRAQGIVTEQEFDHLKKKLMEESSGIPLISEPPVEDPHRVHLTEKEP